MQGQVFDVVVVGSGAAGGTLAAHLARRGIRVAIVEGGPRVNTRTAFNTHAMPFDFPNRQVPTMRPGVEGFDSERSRGVGGKTMLWNAVALRFSALVAPRAPPARRAGSRRPPATGRGAPRSEQ